MSEEKSSAREWLEKSGLKEIFTSITAAAVDTRPKDVHAFIEQWLKENPLVPNAAVETEKAETTEKPRQIEALQKETEPKKIEPSRAITKIQESEDDPAQTARPSKRALKKMFSSPPKDLIFVDFPCRIGHYGSVHKATMMLVENGEKDARKTTVAVKKVPVSAHWTLDEVRHLQDCQDEDQTTDDVKTGKKGRIVRCYGCYYNSSSDELWILMEWVDNTLERFRAERGESLGTPTKKVQQNTTRKTKKAVNEGELRIITIELLKALKHIHTREKNRVHLDLKPANVLISGSFPTLSAVIEPHPPSQPSSRPPSGNAVLNRRSSFASTEFADSVRIVLGDFGTVQEAGTPLEQLGDFAYMAPEVYHRRAVPTAGDMEDPSPPESPTNHNENPDVFTSSVDSWSLGCLLIYLADGFPPIDAEPEVAFDFLHRSFVAPSLHHPTEWGPNFVHFLSLCFERDPKRRPDAAQLLQHPFVTGSSLSDNTWKPL